MTVSQLKIRGFDDSHIEEALRLHLSPAILYKILTRHAKSGPTVIEVMKDILEATKFCRLDEEEK